MALSRPVLLALVGAVLAAAAFFATSGARNKGGDSPAPAKPAATKALRATPAKAAKSAAAAKAAPAKADPASAAKPAPAKPAKLAGVPANVSRALERKQTVVLFFFQRGSADDDATGRAVAGLREGKSVAVFRAPISRLDDYSAVIDGAGVSQAPAVVILGKGGKARLIEGYVDPTTLKQELADSR